MKFFLNIVYQAFFVFGLSFSFFLLFGLAADFRSIDKTDVRDSGAASTVEPADFKLFFSVTPNGVVKHGFVSDYYIDCATGVISYKIRGFVFNFNYFTQRALKVYHPADACRTGGFVPEFE